MEGFPVNDYVYLSATSNEHSLDLPIKIRQYDAKIQTDALLNSGAYSSFINLGLVRVMRTVPPARVVRVDTPVRALLAELGEMAKSTAQSRGMPTDSGKWAVWRL
jgi:hypothetical protein